MQSSSGFMNPLDTRVGVQKDAIVAVSRKLMLPSLAATNPLAYHPPADLAHLLAQLPLVV